MYNLCHKVLKPLNTIPAIMESLARQICRVFNLYDLYKSIFCVYLHFFIPRIYLTVYY